MRVLKIKKMKRINRVQFTPDGARLLVLGGYEVRGTDHVVRIDLATGDEFDRIDVTAEAGAVSRDGTRVAAGGPYLRRAGGSVHWKGVDDARWNAIPAAKGYSVVGVAFAPDGTRAAIGRIKKAGHGDDAEWQGSVTIWHLDPSAVVLSFAVTPDPTVIEFNADGERVAVTGGIDGDPVVAVHDTATGAVVFEYKPKGTQSRGLAFDAAGRLAVVNSKWVYVLPPDGGKPLFVLEAGAKQMNAGVFSPDGRRILTGAHDGALRVWDAADGSPVKSFDWQIGPVTAVAFAPDGLTCAAAGLNGNVVVWDVDG